MTTIIGFNKIFVRNLPWKMGESEINAMFKRYGPVHAVKIITDRETGRPTGNCFVEMDNAEKAMLALNGKSIENKTIHIHPARKRSNEN